jgi:hypothetical protein
VMGNGGHYVFATEGDENGRRHGDDGRMPQTT